MTVGWAIFATFGVVFWFWPFLASYYMYAPLKAVLSSRPRAALYGAIWHAAAHTVLLNGLGSDPFNNAIIVPILVGTLWGSWLPAATLPASKR